MSGRSTIVIVGAGLAGFSVAQALREQGCADRILLIGEEAGLPYDRPPLSKDVLLSGEATAAIDLCPADGLSGIDVELRQAEVAAIDRDAKRLRLADGSTVAYDRLVIASGGDARSLPGLASDGHRIFGLRTRDDALSLAAAMRQARSLLIVGAGWVGLEVASVARDLGLEVTVAGTSSWPCARMLPAEVGAWLQLRHDDAGVRFRLGRACEIRRDGDGFTVGGGERHDLLLAAIGMTARDAIAREAGLICDGGIVTDSGCRTSDPDIFAIGDVAKGWRGALGRHISLQSWKGAVLDARTCAAALLDLPIPPVEAPWFWSEQRGHMIQATGWPQPGDALIAHEEGDRPLWKYGRDGEVRFVVGVDRNRDVRMAHRQLGQAWAAGNLVGEVG